MRAASGRLSSRSLRFGPSARECYVLALIAVGDCAVADIHCCR
ncbi:Ms4533A family Cys-rich leader peptide [Mycobacterium sp.]